MLIIATLKNNMMIISPFYLSQNVFTWGQKLIKMTLYILLGTNPAINDMIDMQEALFKVNTCIQQKEQPKLRVSSRLWVAKGIWEKKWCAGVNA